MKRAWNIGISLLLLAAGLSAQSGSIEAGGYLKYLYSRTSIPGSADLQDHLLHGRFNSRWYATPTLTAALELRARAYDGQTVEYTPDFLDRIRSHHEIKGLDAVLWERTSTVGYAEVDRLWLDYTTGAWQATLGRQRVAFGTCLVWNPTDVFNPYSVLDFDYEERPGVDAVRIQRYLGPVSKLEAVIKPGGAGNPASGMLAWTGNAWDYDFHFLAGFRGQRWISGGSWAGDIAGGGFRGEVLVSQQPLVMGAGVVDEKRNDGIMLSSSLSGDYTFPNTLYLHAEVLYNTAGVTENAGVFRATANALGLLSPARWSFFAEVSYDVTPLVRGSVFVLHNPLDGSAVLVPSVTWSVVTNLDLSAIGLLFDGAAMSEFGGYGKSGYVRLKWSF